MFTYMYITTTKMTKSAFKCIKKFENLHTGKAKCVQNQDFHCLSRMILNLVTMSQL